MLFDLNFAQNLVLVRMRFHVQPPSHDQGITLAVGLGKPGLPDRRIGESGAFSSHALTLLV